MIRITGLPNPSASRMWRMEYPFSYLNKHGFDCRIATSGITDEVCSQSDVVIVHGCVDKAGIATLYAYQQEKGLKIVVEQDDDLEVADDNPHKKEHEVANAKETIIKTMNIADMVSTTTHYLANKLKKYSNNVQVLPNGLDQKSWDLPVLKNTSGKIRIVWAGSLTHLEDLKMIASPVNKILAEYPQVELVIVGEPRASELFSRCEFMLGVPYEAWSQKLHSLRADIALAPLKNTEFNRCKSPIKFLEYSACEIPGVYSPTIYGDLSYNFDGNFGLVAHNEDEWYAKIKHLIDFPMVRQEIAESANAHVYGKKTMKHIGLLYKEAYTNLTA